MLTDLRTRLDAVGRLDVLDSVGKRALAYYEARDLRRADADALGRRARAQLLVGEIDNLRGDLDAALDAYKAAAATTAEQLARDPQDEQRIFDHAQSVFWVGYIAWQRGDAALAREHFTEYHDYARQLADIAPDKDEWQMELDFAYSNLGTLALDQGQVAEAEDYFRKSLAVSSQLAGKDPDDIERLISLGQAHAWLADALHRQARVREAREARLAELALYASLGPDRSGNAAIRHRGATALYRLAQIEIAAGELQEAAARAGAAALTFDRLSADDPDNMELADRASLASAVLGEAHFHLGQMEQARTALGRAIDIAERLVERDGSVARWRDQNLTLPQLTLARIHVATGNPASGRRLFVTVSDHLRQTVSAGDADPGTTRIYCAALAGQARLAALPESLWTEIVATLSRNVGRQSPDGLVLLAEAEAALGRPDNARDIASRLTSAGYRHPDLRLLVERDPVLSDLITVSAAR